MKTRLALASLVLMTTALACGGRDDVATGDAEVKASEIWAPRKGSARRDALVAALRNFDASIDAVSRKAKYDAMAESPFAFFRGTAHLYYRDLADGTRRWEQSRFYSPRTSTWIQGDLHTQNFGTYDDASGAVVFGLNDFDEAVVTSYLLDVWRLGTSIALVASANHLSRSSVDAMTDKYLDTALKGEALPAPYGLVDELLAEHGSTTKARAAMLAEWTNGDKLRIDGEKLSPATDAERTALTSGLRSIDVVDLARRLDAGTGSLGVARFYVLTRDQRILDVKEQRDPAALPYLTDADRAATHVDCRVITAERALRANVPTYFGCVRALDKTFTVRERSPFKDDLAPEELDSETRLTKLAEQWGAIAAAAHLRARPGFDVALREVVDDKDDFRHEVKELAAAYADQVAIDYALFIDARKSGALSLD